MYVFILCYIMNLRKLAQQTGCPFSIQRPLRKRRQPSPENNFCPRNLVTASLQLSSQPSLGWWLANFLPPAKSIFHQHVGRTDRMGLGRREEWHVFFFFCLRHCREGGGQEPVMEALWDETNRHAVVMRVLWFIRSTGVQSLCWMRKLSLEIFPCV